ncbi:MAG: polysaccharide pyruvyl transferase CsaB [Cyanobacteria bacterium P01_A01_bin.37]
MRVALCGYYGMDNAGDEALLASLLQMLPPHVTPVVLSGNPSQTRARYGITACNRRSVRAVIGALRSCDAFIWGGGSLMQDATSAFSPFYYGGLMLLAQQMGLKTIAWAQGLGPLHRGTTRWITQRSLVHCNDISVRDPGSAQLLKQWNIACHLAPDPVWALESVPVPGLWDSPAPRVAVALRPHPALTAKRLDVFIQALTSFQQATQVHLLLIPFQPSNDVPIAKAIHTAIPNASEILVLNDPHQLKGAFKGVEMAIAMRFHGLIMAAALECRCFAVSYDPKVDQLMHDLNLPGWKIAEMPENPNDICTAWLDHYANGVGLSDTQVAALADRALIHQQLLEAQLANP